jgi:hypothetical protein
MTISIIGLIPIIMTIRITSLMATLSIMTVGTMSLTATLSIMTLSFKCHYGVSHF